MVLLIKILRPVAYLLGIAGILLVLNASDAETKKIGWGLVIAMVPFFIAVNVMTAVRIAKQKHTHRRR
jgi:hypothetical protein